jgi:hypothetical protein
VVERRPKIFIIGSAPDERNELVVGLVGHEKEVEFNLQNSSGKRPFPVFHKGL